MRGMWMAKVEALDHSGYDTGTAENASRSGFDNI